MSWTVRSHRNLDVVNEKTRFLRSIYRKEFSIIECLVNVTDPNALKKLDLIRNTVPMSVE